LILSVLLFIALRPACANAQATVRATIGWGDVLRVGHWTPVFVTVTSAQVRNVILEIHGPSGDSAAVCVRQRAASQNIPTTYALLYPLNGDLSETQVIVSDEATGKTLATQVLEDYATFTAAGRVPMKKLASDETLIGISGSIQQAVRLKAQLARAGLASGLLDENRLPTSSVGYEGISVLVLTDPNLQDIEPLQQQAILNWVHAGGSLVVIPGTNPLPARSEILEALPCDIGQNIAISPGNAATQPTTLNARELHPRQTPVQIDLFGSGPPGEYSQAVGLGHIAVLPADVSPLEFSDDASARILWRKIFTGIVPVPDPPRITAIEIGDAQEDVLRTGPKASDSYGRGPGETIAIRHLLELLNGAQTRAGHDWPTVLLTLVGLFFVLGPLDSIILMRLGRSPGHWLTRVSWIGLIGCAMGWVVAIGAPSTSPQVNTFRLIDQLDASTLAHTDIVTILSPQTRNIALSLDQKQWWEPANQAALSMPPDRFVDIACHEDRDGCRPDFLHLNVGDPRSMRGESIGAGAPLLDAKFSVRRDTDGSTHLIGKLANLSKISMTDFEITTPRGGCRLAQTNLAAGASVDVNELLTNHVIAPADLPGDVMEIAPDRTSLLNTMVKTGNWACIYCQMPDAPPVQVSGDSTTSKHFQLVRAIVPIAK
jgi:hypothetical protein